MRNIVVNKDNWLENVRTGEVKQAKDLTQREAKKQEWRVLNRKERRQRRAMKTRRVK